jgi:hypothetical protein
MGVFIEALKIYFIAPLLRHVQASVNHILGSMGFLTYARKPRNNVHKLCNETGFYTCHQSLVVEVKVV